MARTLLILLLLAPLLGCSASHWTGKTDMVTEITIDPLRRSVTFLDTKDNDITIEKFEVKFGKNGMSFDKLIIKNIASVPIAAEVARIEAVGRAQLTQVAYVESLSTGIAEIIDVVAKLCGTVGIDFSPPLLPDAADLRVSVLQSIIESRTAPLAAPE